MRRIIFITAAFVIAASIVYMAATWRGGATEPAPPDLTRVLALLDITPSPTGQLSTPQIVPLPSEVQPTVAHPFFPLLAGHAGLQCVDCHVEGVERAISADCIFCHRADDIHNGANGSDCATCHAPAGWQFVDFDHSTIDTQDCVGCHQPPVNHFPGACTTCHLDTTNFNNASFDHATLNGQDCVGCHQPPPNHYPGSCSSCHLDTSSFLNVQFNHSNIGTQDCVGCHQPPPNHYAGSCSSCHLDTSSFLNVQFNHSNIGTQDCVGCHQPPPNHYAGSCSSCHLDTSNFLNVQFNHSNIGTQDCAGCHQPPPNHFQGSCSTCHQDTTNFSNATFNHTFPLNHGDANGVCTTCHVTNNPPAYTCTTCHNDQADLVEEHNDEGIFDLSNCVRCHLDGEEPDDD